MQAEIATKRSGFKRMVWVGLFRCHNDGSSDVHLIEQADHVFVEHANAAKADSSSEIDPVGPSCSVDGVFTAPKLEVGHVTHPNWILGTRRDDLSFLVIDRRIFHAGDLIAPCWRW